MFEKVKRKYELMSKPAKASIWFTICYILQRGIQYISMPIYTRLLSTDEYGVYSLFLSWFNLICVFTSLNLYWGTFNKAMVKYEDKQREYMSSVQFLTLLTTIGFCIIGFIFIIPISKSTGFSPKIQVMMYLHLLSFPPLQYWSQKQRFDYKYKAMIAVTISISVLTLLIGTIGLIIIPNSSDVLIFVTVVTKAVFCLFILLYIFNKGRVFYNKEYWSWSLKMAIPLIPHYLSEILLGHADRLMIGKMCGNSEAGIYNVAYQISMAMTIIRSGIEATFTPWMYRKLKDNRYESIRSVTTGVSIAMGTMTFLFMLLGPELLKIAASKEYYEAIWDMPAIMIGCFFIFVYTLFLNIEIYYEKRHYASIASFIAAGLNVLLNYFCIKKFGYLAAGYTTMISYLIMAVLHYVFYKRTTNENKESVFDSKLIMLISVVLIALGLLCLVLYRFTIIRYMIIIFIIVFSAVFRNRILKIIKDLKAG